MFINGSAPVSLTGSVFHCRLNSLALRLAGLYRVHPLLLASLLTTISQKPFNPIHALCMCISRVDEYICFIAKLTAKATDVAIIAGGSLCLCRVAKTLELPLLPVSCGGHKLSH